jgi:hypothetical protein
MVSDFCMDRQGQAKQGPGVHKLLHVAHDYGVSRFQPLLKLVFNPVAEPEML